jgi:ribosomal protein S27AE
MELADLLSELSLDDVNRYEKAILEGYKDEKCPKCGTWFLAFHHFIRCDLAPCGGCPMASNPKSILTQFMDSIEKGED